MTFSGKAGSVNSQAGTMVAGFGSTAIRYSQGLTAGMTPTARLSSRHTFVFTIVSITIYRAVSRAKAFVSVFRTQ